MYNITKETIEKIVKQYGDAFYILDSRQFEANFEKLYGEFKKNYSNFNIAYSYKTNYTPYLCKIINEKGGYAEVVSEMELELAYRIGANPSKIIWNGPIKKSEKMLELLLAGGTVNVDSIDELREIAFFARQSSGSIFHIGIRCNFDVKDGVVSRFGIDSHSDDFDECIQMIRENENIELINLQCHYAKRNIEWWPNRARGMVDVVKKVESTLGYIPKRIDIGGGLYGNMDDALKAQFEFVIPSYEEYAKAAATVFAEAFPDAGPELLIEPGSALVGDCMHFVGKVKTIKKVRGKMFATVLGSQKNISMSGVNPPMTVIPSGENRNQYEDVDIVGYTCIEGDVLYRGYTGELAVGDYVVFSNCGSYSIVMKPPFILPNFPIVDISRDDVKLIKRQETFDDIFKTYLF